jgi:hypothetical protein
VPGSPAAQAVYGIWSGRRAVEVITADRDEQIAAAVTVATQLCVRTELRVIISTPWYAERVAVAWALAGHLPLNRIGCSSARFDLLPPVGVGPSPDRPVDGVTVDSLGLASWPSPGSKERQPRTPVTGLQDRFAAVEARKTVTVAIADHESDQLQAAAWSTSRLVVIAPCSVVPDTPPHPAYALGDIPFDVVLAGAP